MMAKKISFNTHKGKTVTYDGHRTTITKARKDDKMLTDWKPMYITDPSIFDSYRSRDLSEIFYDAMKIWFIAFLMIGWAGLMIRFVGWLFGG